MRFFKAKWRIAERVSDKGDVFYVVEGRPWFSPTYFEWGFWKTTPEKAQAEWEVWCATEEKRRRAGVFKTLGWW